MKIEIGTTVNPVPYLCFSKEILDALGWPEEFIGEFEVSMNGKTIIISLPEEPLDV
jgi:hypothetical protein